MKSSFWRLWNRYRNVIVYVIFGGLTTAVNYGVYLPCLNLVGLSAAMSNVFAWIAAVIFAYLTNKPFVFHSHDWSMKTVLSEAARFGAVRLGSGALETVLLLIFVDWLNYEGNICKIAVSIFVIVLNYLSSKLLVFRK